MSPNPNRNMAIKRNKIQIGPDIGCIIPEHQAIWDIIWEQLNAQLDGTEAQLLSTLPGAGCCQIVLAHWEYTMCIVLHNGQTNIRTLDWRPRSNTIQSINDIPIHEINDCYNIADPDFIEKLQEAITAHINHIKIKT